MSSKEPDVWFRFVRAHRTVIREIERRLADAGLPPSDPAREARQIERLRALAVEAELDPEFSEKFIRFVIEEVIRHHRQARGRPG